MVDIPALNEIAAQGGFAEREYADEPSDKRYMILFPDDYREHGVDMAGNVALLLDKEDAKEIRALANDIIREIDASETNSAPEDSEDG